VSQQDFPPPQLRYHRGSTTVADDLGPGQQQVCLGAGWSWLCQTGGKLLATSHRNHPYSPPTAETLPCKPTTATMTSFKRANILHEDVCFLFIEFFKCLNLAGNYISY